MLCCCYNVKEVEQLVFLSEFRSNSSYKQYVNVMGGGGSLKAVGNILLKREGGWSGAKAGSGREMLGTGAVSILKQNISASFQM